MDRAAINRVNNALLLLNDWIGGVDLHISMDSEMSSELKPWLNAVVFGPPIKRYRSYKRFIKGGIARRGMLVPLTDDPHVILRVLEFKKPAAVIDLLCRELATSGAAASALCSSPLFDPEMVINTKVGKFCGKSAIYKYVEDTWGISPRSHNKLRISDRITQLDPDQDEEMFVAQRRRVLDTIASLWPPGLNTIKDALAATGAMMQEVQETLWRPSVRNVPETCNMSIFWRRFQNYVFLRGLETLCQSCRTDPSSALDAWLQFRGDSDSMGPHDCLLTASDTELLTIL